MYNAGEKWVSSLHQEDALKKEMATHRTVWWATVHGATKSHTQLKQLRTAQQMGYRRLMAPRKSSCFLKMIPIVTPAKTCFSAQCHVSTYNKH